MKKHLLILITGLALGSSAMAQIQPFHVLSSMGTFYDVSGVGSLSSTAGELALINTFTSTRFILTQGFQQGNLTRFVPTSLPVTMLDFYGYNEGTINRLQWQTASEINNAGFDLERMNNTTKEFEKIGFVQGHGTTNELLDYDLNDTRPQHGDNYYRLKQIDVDGKYTYTDVISIYYGQAIGTEVSVYPVPVTDRLNVVIRSGADTQGAMVITNVMGAVIHEEAFDIYEGTTVSHVDMTAFATGQYFVKVTTGSDTHMTHIVRQ